MAITMMAPAVAVSLLLLAGCEDSRISVQEFIAMQERMARENGARNDVPRSCGTHKAAVSCDDANCAPQPCREKPQKQCPPKHAAPKHPAKSHPTAAPESPRPEPVSDEHSALRRSHIVQVKAQGTGEPDGNESKGNWFFDTKRGEWVRVKLPQKRRKHVRQTSLYANQNASYASEPSEEATYDSNMNDSANAASARGNDVDGDAPSSIYDSPKVATVEPATPSAMPHFVPVQSNVPVRNEPLEPIQNLLELAKKPYLLGSEDLLTVTLTGLTGIDTIAEPAEVEARVDHDGNINLPLVGSVNVGGVDLVSAEDVIHKAYVPKFVPTLAVGIRVEQYKTTDVVVVGAAVTPGLVNLRRNQRTVLHAVAAAGGMTQLASGEVIVQRMRDPDNKIHVYLRNSADLKAVLSMDPLESGDVLNVVAAQPNTIFVGGLVNLPGPREFPPGTEVTALQALAAAGGPVETVFPKEATLIRQMPNGKDVHVRIDLDKLRSGEDPNLELKPGDIFWVPETWGTRTMAFINQSFFIRAGATVSYNVTGIEFLNRARQQVGNVGGNGGTLQNNVDPLGFLAP